jgi:hypothetical protein
MVIEEWPSISWMSFRSARPRGRGSRRRGGGCGAGAAGAHHVDTYTPFEGHDACADAGTRWIEPLLADSDAAAVHPNERGERAMTDAVLHTLTTSV